MKYAYIKIRSSSSYCSFSVLTGNDGFCNEYISSLIGGNIQDNGLVSVQRDLIAVGLQLR